MPYRNDVQLNNCFDGRHLCLQLLTMALVTMRGAGMLWGQTLTIPGADVPTANVNQDLSVRTATGQTSAVADLSLSLETSLLDRFVSRQTVTSNNVSTVVMEANVQGVQTTTTNISLCSVFSDNTARLNIVAAGVVSSNTIGVTPQAQVTSLGSHTFNITKPVIFDGERFLTKPAYGSLQARQVPQAVHSVASGLPILGQIGDRVAWNEVYRRMPLSDAIVVRKVADDVLPKVNSSVDQQLADLNRNWSTGKRTLESLDPAGRFSWKAQSTATGILLSLQNSNVPRRSQAGSITLSPMLADNETAVLTVSQDSVNHWLANQPWRGITVTDAALQAVVQAFQQPDAPRGVANVLSRLKEAIQAAQEPFLFSVKLADEFPVELDFVAGVLTLHVKFRIIPKGGSASLMHRVSVTLKGQSATDGDWSVVVQQISAAPASNNELPDAWTKLINQQASLLVERIPPFNVPRTIDLRRFNDKLPPMRIHRIQAEGGLLRCSVRRDEPAIGLQP